MGAIGLTSVGPLLPNSNAIICGVSSTTLTGYACTGILYSIGCDCAHTLLHHATSGRWGCCPTPVMRGRAKAHALLY
eukprot:1925397-Lingulodinium_polyedra.AAC.1